MIKILFEENLAAYIIFGIFVIGIVFKIFLRVSLKSLIDQSDNLHATNKNILKQIKLKYESLIRLNQEVFNVKAFINKFLFKYKCIVNSWVYDKKHD